MTARSMANSIRTAAVALLAATLVTPASAAACPGCCSGRRTTAFDGCCHGRPASPPRNAHANGLCCNGVVDNAACSCHLQPQRQTIPPERQANYTPQDLLAALPIGAPPVAGTLDDQVLLTKSDRARLAQTIPPRILYCSWII